MDREGRTEKALCKTDVKHLYISRLFRGREMVRFPLLAPKAKGTPNGVPFAFGVITGARTRFKLPATSGFCSLGAT